MSNLLIKIGESLNFVLENYILKFYNNTDNLNFELRSYHEGLVIYKIVLDFFDDIGGIF